MKNKAFTLSELLVCLAILGLLIVIAIPSIIGVVNRNKEKQYTFYVEEIKVSTSTYVNEHRNEFTTTTCDPKCTIPTSELVMSGYLDGDLINPKTEEKVSGRVEITFDSNNDFVYTYIER